MYRTNLWGSIEAKCCRISRISVSTFDKWRLPWIRHFVQWPLTQNRDDRIAKTCISAYFVSVGVEGSRQIGKLEFEKLLLPSGHTAENLATVWCFAISLLEIELISAVLHARVCVDACSWVMCPNAQLGLLNSRGDCHHSRPVGCRYRWLPLHLQGECFSGLQWLFLFFWYVGEVQSAMKNQLGLASSSMQRGLCTIYYS